MDLAINWHTEICRLLKNIFFLIDIILRLLIVKCFYLPELRVFANEIIDFDFINDLFWGNSIVNFR